MHQRRIAGLVSHVASPSQPPPADSHPHLQRDAADVDGQLASLRSHGVCVIRGAVRGDRLRRLQAAFRDGQARARSEWEASGRGADDSDDLHRPGFFDIPDAFETDEAYIEALEQLYPLLAGAVGEDVRVICLQSRTVPPPEPAADEAEADGPFHQMGYADWCVTPPWLWAWLWAWLRACATLSKAGCHIGTGTSSAAPAAPQRCTRPSPTTSSSSSRCLTRPVKVVMLSRFVAVHRANPGKYHHCRDGLPNRRRARDVASIGGGSAAGL